MVVAVGVWWWWVSGGGGGLMGGKGLEDERVKIGRNKKH